MKKVKLMTLAMFVGASSMTFTSCGEEGAKDEKAGSEASSTEGGEEGEGKPAAAATSSYDLNTGIGQFQNLVGSLENGQVTIDKSDQATVKSHFDVKDKYYEEGEDRMGDKSTFAGYYLNKDYTFYKTQLNSVSYNAYYDEGNEDQVVSDGEAVMALLTETYGKPESRKYPSWETDNYKIDFYDSDNGYSVTYTSVTVDKYKQDRLDAIIPGGKAETEIEKLLTALEDGSLVLNETSNADFATWANMEKTDYYMDDKLQYEDHYLRRNVDISSDKVTKIAYNVSEDTYDYDNPSMAEEDLATMIETKLGTPTSEAGKEKTWVKDGYSIKLKNDYGIDLTIE